MDESVKQLGSLIPITLFSSVKDNDASTFLHLTWPELVRQLRDFATEPFAKKSDAPLFTSSVFSPKHRAKANVESSGMVILDVDGSRNPEHATLDGARQVFDENGLGGLIYTTASHSPARHRYRILIPLEAPVSGAIYTRAFHALDALFGHTADLGKRGCESLFYLPGDYAGVDNRIVVFDGIALTGETWAGMCPDVEPEAPRIKRTTASPGSIKPTRSNERHCEWASLFDCPFVTTKMIDDYRDRQRADSWHLGLYVFMCSVAGRTKYMSHEITSQELADLATRLDQFDGGYYPDRDLEREATNAINFIY